MSKWKNGETNEDKSSRPHQIVYALNELEEVCKANYIERLIQPNTPKTNGMVERANGIIKKETIIKENYANIYIEHSRNKEKMNEALMAFLVYYMLYR